MARIKDKFEDHNKDELLAEIQARNIEGITMATHKEDMIAALEASNEELAKASESEKAKSAEAEAPSDPRDAELARLRKQVDEMEKARAANVIVPVTSKAGPPVVPDPQRNDLDTFKAGVYKDRESGEQFRLKILPENEAENGRTHLLANKEHFREITEERFRATMEKV